MIFIHDKADKLHSTQAGRFKNYWILCTGKQLNFQIHWIEHSSVVKMSDMLRKQQKAEKKNVADRYGRFKSFGEKENQL